MPTQIVNSLTLRLVSRFIDCSRPSLDCVVEFPPDSRFVAVYCTFPYCTVQYVCSWPYQSSKYFRFLSKNLDFGPRGKSYVSMYCSVHADNSEQRTNERKPDNVERFNGNKAWFQT
jgi:hypothetical protein